MQMRINTLLLDKFALNFKFRRCQRHGRELQKGLQQCQADKGLLVYNRDRIFDRYYNKFKDRKASHIKWKNRERNSQQLILNLNQQIFVLQNNLHINIQINMALQPLPLPKFSGEYDEDIDIFNSRLSSYLAGVG